MPLPPLTEGMSSVKDCPSIADCAETAALKAGCESSATEIVKLNAARSALEVSASESLAVQVIVVSPAAVGVPLIVRVDAVQVSPDGSAVERSA